MVVSGPEAVEQYSEITKAPAYIPKHTAIWRRDPGIGELIRHFDQDNKIHNWENLTNKELQAIHEQMRMCALDFRYAARNYFRIAHKHTRQEMPFQLWESQELILEELLRLKAQGKAQRLLIIKGRQLGSSTLIEALIAWRTMFWPNTISLVVSRDAPHAEYLFSIMLHIYDHVPWWMKPMTSNRTFDGGIVFENPDLEARRKEPGLNSRITVQAATQYSGIGQGLPLSGVHCSEFCDWQQEKVRDAIEGDIGKALIESPDTIAVAESTGKNAGSWSHKWWRKCVELGERSKWKALFLPYFMEKTRVMAPPGGWRPDQPEIDMRNRVASEWVKCDFEPCGMWHASVYMGASTIGAKCRTCNTGILKPYMLSNPQLCWMWNERVNAEKDIESLKTLREELTSTAEESFQLHGLNVFTLEMQQYADSCVRPPTAEGFLDRQGKFHGVKEIIRHQDSGQEIGSKCWAAGCDLDHRFETSNLRIWEWPNPGSEYACGVDVAGGMGETSSEADYSVVAVIRLGGAHGPDVQVATFRSNLVTSIELAYIANYLGLWYNEALMSIEYNTYQTCGDTVRLQLSYPNLYRWKHLDSVSSVQSNKYHWITQANSKPRLYENMAMRLKARLIEIRSDNCVEELKTFQKEEFASKSAGAAEGMHDDEILATMIADYTAHENEYDPNLGYIPIRTDTGKAENLPWLMICQRCGNEWGSEDPEGERCLKCGFILLLGKRVGMSEKREVILDLDQILLGNKIDEEYNQWEQNRV